MNRDQRQRAWATAFAVVLLGAAAGGFSTVLRAAKIQLTKLPIHPQSGLTFPSLPTETVSWTRYGPERPPLDAEALEQLGTNNYISRMYVRKRPLNPQHPVRLDLHCAYYTGTIDTVPHIPERCFVGGGLARSAGPFILPVPLDASRFTPDPTTPLGTDHEPVLRARTAEGRRVRLPRGIERLQMRVTEFLTPQGETVYSGYFFLANGGVVASANRVRELAFRLQDTYAYYAKVQITSADVDSPEELTRHAAAFLDEMLPYILLRVPDWIDVEQGRYPPRPDNPGALGADADAPSAKEVSS
ncbi:MAG: exosortase-associated EpsI family protein [Planctomycetota bacterium]|nr:MAG: exosortase-associated EpsI family protein [Planctomycetota bacterium]